MKSNLKKLVLLLPVLPMLMANAPAPIAHPTKYEDFDISISEVNKHPDDAVCYQYSYDVKNTGVGYIRHIYVNLEKGDNKYDYEYLEDQSFDSVFYGSLIIPNQEMTVKGNYKHSESSISNYKKVNYSASAYTDFADDVTVKGDYSLTKGTYSRNAYEVNISLEDKNDNKFNYGVIFKITYDGYDSYVHSDEMNKFDIRVMDGFELAKLTNIEVVKVTKSKAYHSHLGEVINAVAITFLVCVILLVSMGIFSAIFFPIMKKKRRARRAAALRAKQENASLNNDK